MALEWRCAQPCETEEERYWVIQDITKEMQQRTTTKNGWTSTGISGHALLLSIKNSSKKVPTNVCHLHFSLPANSCKN
jgi:hypothetical protein